MVEISPFYQWDSFIVDLFTSSIGIGLLVGIIGVILVIMVVWKILERRRLISPCTPNQYWSSAWGCLDKTTTPVKDRCPPLYLLVDNVCQLNMIELKQDDDRVKATQKKDEFGNYFTVVSDPLF